MFDDKSELIKKRKDNIIATKEKSICFFKEFFLWNEKTIIYKRKKWDKDIESLYSFFKNVKNRWNIESKKNKRKSKVLFYIYIDTEKKHDYSINTEFFY